MLLGSNIEEGHIRWELARRISEKSNRSLSASRLAAGDLVMVRVGYPGVTAVVAPEIDGCNCASMMIVRRHSSFDSRWLCSIMNSRHGRNQVEHVQYGTAQKQFNISDAINFSYAVPPLAEQRVIADVLSDMDTLIEAIEQLLAKKRDVKQGAMQELLSGKRRLPGFSGTWKEKMIGDFTDCTAGGTPSTRVPAYWGGNIRWMSSGELHLKRVFEVEGRITEAGLKSSSTQLVPAQCVLIGLAGQGKTRGTVAINMVPLCTNQSIAAIFPNGSFEPLFLYYNLDTRYDELRELSSGDGGRGGLNLTLIRSLRVPLPPTKEEQGAIASVLADIDEEISAVEQKLAKARLVKQGMMQELLTGRIRLV